MPSNGNTYDTSLSYCVFAVGKTGLVDQVIELRATSDLDAIEQARQLVNDQTVELWKRGRKLVCLAPTRTIASKLPSPTSR